MDLLLLGVALGEEEGVCVSPVGTGDCLASPAHPRAFCSLQTSPWLVPLRSRKLAVISAQVIKLFVNPQQSG